MSRVVCPTCKGLGYKERRVTTNFHKNEYDVFRDECPVCDGAGIVEMVRDFKPVENRYKEEAERLWKLLDDISTLDDACKGDHFAFRTQVYKIAEKRNEKGLGSYDGQTLEWR